MEVSMFKVGQHVLLYVNRKVFKIDHIYKKAVWLDSGKESLDIVNIDDLDRIATPQEITVGHCIDNGKCPHGYDLACLLCGFGTEAGKRIYHQWAKERPISRRRARKLRKRHGVSVYFSKRLECLVWVKTA